MRKTPTSKIEKLIAGLTAIQQHQAAATLTLEGDSLYVGDTEDPYLTEGMKTYVRGFGFTMDRKSKRFRFVINQPDE
ncbi:MAG: hypothetical protein MJA29_06290 [Candidatus Omnitrophica bacterium]|nr:hypothetical protein [Candidatus Omnitrophota bacterium]